jgi:PIN domain nuclease of toxin-antitoxin system
MGGHERRAAWFEQAWSLSWARDPFDRLIVAHARLRGWKLATADSQLLEQLGPTQTLPL